METVVDIEKLYNQYGFLVFRRARSLLFDESEAHDAVHEVFLQLLEKPQAFQQRSSIGTFLYRMTTNICLNRLRYTAYRNGRWLAEVARSIENRHPSQKAEERIAQRQLVERLLADSDPQLVSMVCYHYFDELTQAEIAQLLGVTRATVNRKLKRFQQQAQHRALEVPDERTTSV